MGWILPGEIGSRSIRNFKPHFLVWLARSLMSGTAKVQEDVGGDGDSLVERTSM